VHNVCFGITFLKNYDLKIQKDLHFQIVCKILKANCDLKD
jgi:hypothetical protein